MKRKELEYDYNKTLFQVYFAAVIAICLAAFGVIITNREEFNIILFLAILAIASLFGMIMFFKRFHNAYIHMRKKLP